MKAWAAFLLIVLTACGGGGGSGSAPVMAPAAAAAPAAKPPERICTVRLEGDSIMAGGIAAELQRIRPAWTVHDRSVIGTTAASRMPFFLNEPNSSAVTVLQWGINDAGQGSPYETPMRAMIERVRSTGGIVVLTGIAQHTPPLAGAAENDAIARRLSEEYGLRFADWGSVPVPTRDGLHPTEEGAVLLTAKLAETLDLTKPECR